MWKTMMTTPLAVGKMSGTHEPKPKHANVYVVSPVGALFEALCSPTSHGSYLNSPRVIFLSSFLLYIPEKERTSKARRKAG